MKVECDKCGSKFDVEDMPDVPNPNKRSRIKTVSGCPKCKRPVNIFVSLIKK